MILRENMDLSMRHVRRRQESGSLGPTVLVGSGHKERRVNVEKNPGLGQSRSYNSVNLQQNARQTITSRRRRDADSRAPSQSSLPRKAAISIMSISIIEIWPSECYGYAMSTIDTVSAQPTEQPLFLFR